MLRLFGIRADGGNQGYTTVHFRCNEIGDFWSMITDDRKGFGGICTFLNEINDS
ncbi:hypothetical protein D3C87_2194010 [compost metagenome]